MNLYDILGVGKKASPDEIKRAYKKRAQKVHLRDDAAHLAPVDHRQLTDG